MSQLIRDEASAVLDKAQAFLDVEHDPAQGQHIKATLYGDFQDALYSYHLAVCAEEVRQHRALAIPTTYKHSTSDPACSFHRPPKTAIQKILFEYGRGLACEACGENARRDINFTGGRPE